MILKYKYYLEDISTQNYDHILKLINLFNQKNFNKNKI